MRLYLDTSVFGGAIDTEFKEWSLRLFSDIHHGRHSAVISDVTVREIDEAPPRVRDILNSIPEDHRVNVFADEVVISLANRYIDEKVISERSFNDAVHIALATIHAVDALISWNFKHIVNLSRIRLYNSVNLKYGYSTIDIRSPREVLYETKTL